jgi:predicted ATPase
MDPQIRRRRTLEALKRIVLREALNQPLIVVFEDLHWIDSETQALLDLLAESIGSARVRLLVNYRPEYRHEWSGQGHYLQIRLDPLGRENASAMLAALLGEGAELEALKRSIAERSSGNPFFIEEMGLALFEQGILARNVTVKLVRPLSQAHLPVTVQGILASRIRPLARFGEKATSDARGTGCGVSAKPGETHHPKERGRTRAGVDASPAWRVHLRATHAR